MNPADDDATPVPRPQADIPIPMPDVVPPAASAMAAEIPTLEVGGLSRIHFVGGEKGGVGKSTLARLLAQYLIDHTVPFAAFDSDRSHGTLSRFYPDHTQNAFADSYESLDRIVETAIEQPGRRVLVDLAAQTHDLLVRWMDDSGVLDMADVSGIAVQYWHVMDAGRDSVELLRRLLDRFGQRLQYIIVRNQLRGDDFGILDRSGQLVRARGLGARVVDIKHLHDPIVQTIDARNASFHNAKNSQAIDGASLSLMERQRLRLWMNHAYAGIAAAGV
jgi:ABC-type dipeptide/oligopeptide/nickel transport system ATPase subunit